MDKKGLAVGLFPVMFTFFIMGFVDIVGISTSYIKHDFALNDTIANLLPMMVFIWFAFFSIPAGLMMNVIGRKKTVLISLFITFAAMLIPFVVYEYKAILIAFALLGIGNTILQVSLNPLLTNLVKGERLASSMTLGQFIKAIASFLGPVIAGVITGLLGNWKFIFPLFALITLITTIWLLLTPIEEGPAKLSSSSFVGCIRLLKDRTILMFFLGILFLVGFDVGFNTTIPKFLMERFNIDLPKAGLGISLYFVARTVGSFVGAILLIKMSGRKLFLVSMAAAIIAMLLMLVFGNLWAILLMVFIIGLSIANIFSIIFSKALQRIPEKANEISGLMIMGVAGGAIFPPVMGIVSDKIGQAGGLLVLFIALFYLFFCAVKLDRA
jgi:MFS transporter, FHS family, L-fucose permease